MKEGKKCFKREGQGVLQSKTPVYTNQRPTFYSSGTANFAAFYHKCLTVRTGGKVAINSSLNSCNNIYLPYTKFVLKTSNKIKIKVVVSAKKMLTICKDTWNRYGI